MTVFNHDPVCPGTGPVMIISCAQNFGFIQSDEPKVTKWNAM